MMLEEAQIQAAEHGLDPTNVGGARGLKRKAQWPGGVVPYTIHQSASKPISLNTHLFYFHTDFWPAGHGRHARAPCLHTLTS